MASAYLDTCVVSGIAKGDLASETEAAVLEILRIYKDGKLGLVTSETTATEIHKIPAQYRAKHEMIYNLLANVPVAATHRTDSGLTLMGVGGGTRVDPLYSALKAIVPDEQDAVHLFQAAMNKVKYFVTTDNKTILRYAMNIRSACGVLAVSPLELVAEISNETA